MIAYEHVLRATVNESELEYLRVSGDTQATLPSLHHIDADLLTNTDVSWRGHASFLMSADTLNTCNAVEELWPGWAPGDACQGSAEPRRPAANDHINHNPTPLGTTCSSY